MKIPAASLGLFLLLGACAAGQAERPVIASTMSAVQLRSIQSRTFDTTDRDQVLRGAIATLQHLGYAVIRVSPEAGSVTAVKKGRLRMTVSVYPRGTVQTVVRANALLPMGAGDTQIDDPLFYRNLFFEPLSQTLALAAMAAPEREDEAPMPAVPPDNPIRPAKVAAAQ